MPKEESSIFKSSANSRFTVEPPKPQAEEDDDPFDAYMK
jgi:hypothetical protein